MGKIKKGLGYVVAVEQYVCCALLVVMLSICFVAVVMRYAFNSPIVWSEEVILTCLIWFGFMCISIGIYRDDHIAIEGVFNKLPPLARKALTVFRHVLLMVFCMFMTYYGWKIFKEQRRETKIQLNMVPNTVPVIYPPITPIPSSESRPYL